MLQSSKHMTASDVDGLAVVHADFRPISWGVFSNGRHVSVYFLHRGPKGVQLRPAFLKPITVHRHAIKFLRHALENIAISQKKQNTPWLFLSHNLGKNAVCHLVQNIFSGFINGKAFEHQFLGSSDIVIQLFQFGIRAQRGQGRSNGSCPRDNHGNYRNRVFGFPGQSHTSKSQKHQENQADRRQPSGLKRALNAGVFALTTKPQTVLGPIHIPLLL